MTYRDIDMVVSDAPIKVIGGLTHSEILIACQNIGVNLE